MNRVSMSVLRSRSLSSQAVDLGFLRPCAPQNIGRPPSGPRWLHEVKHDGYRIIAQRRGGSVRLWTRSANDLGGRLSRIAEAVKALPCRDCTIDGEAVVQRDDGHYDFFALKSHAGAAKAVLMGFDLIEVDGDDLRKEPLEVRRSKLEWLVRSSGSIQFSTSFDLDGQKVFEHACELAFEGIVSKRKGSIYRSGSSPDWAKTLNPAYIRHRG
jgi:bifunctional non-homologous end joining protein LigD